MPFRIYSSSETLIDISGNSDFAGAIYAPNADVKLRGNRNVKGSIIAKNSTMEGSVTFTYDANLANQDEPNEIDARIRVKTTLWSQN